MSFINHPYLILASASKARLHLLQQINIIPNLVVSPNVDETPLKNEKPLLLCKRLSLLKATATFKQYPNSYVIAADTVVYRGSKILGKPKNLQEAQQFLQLLSGHKHKIITGVTVCAPNYKPLTKVITTVVAFKILSVTEINYYLSLNQWQNRAGACDIQGYAELFVKQIIGSYSNIVGLPLQTTYNMLKGLGYNH